jgi:hypothetical protein
MTLVPSVYAPTQIASSSNRNVLEGLAPVPVGEVTRGCVRVHALNGIDERGLHLWRARPLSRWSTT